MPTRLSFLLALLGILSGCTALSPYVAVALNSTDSAQAQIVSRHPSSFRWIASSIELRPQMRSAIETLCHQGFRIEVLVPASEVPFARQWQRNTSCPLVLKWSPLWDSRGYDLLIHPQTGVLHNTRPSPQAAGLAQHLWSQASPL